MEFTVGQIAKLLKGTVQGNPNQKVNMVADIQNAGPNQITFLSNIKYEQFLYSTKAAAVIVKTDFAPKKKIAPSLILVDDPYSGFTTLLETYQSQSVFRKVGVEDPCYKGKNTKIGKNVYRGAFSYIGDNVEIGDNVKLHPHVFIGDNTVVGDNTIFYSGVKVYASTKIGNDCIIHSGVVLGSDGFGFAPQEDGSYRSIPQLGNVILGDNVNIGANTVIDCATLAGHATTVRSGVKLDNLIQVGHNVEIGKNTVIAAQVGISGSTKIGGQCIIAGQVGIAGHLAIANKTSIGAQAGIIKSIAEEGQQLLGSPVLGAREYLRSYAVFKHLPEMNRRINELESKLKPK